MKRMSRLDKHLDENNTIEINGETFVLSRLGTKYSKHYLKAMKLFDGLKEDSDPLDFLKNVTDEVSESVTVLVESTLEKSLPDEWEEDSDKVKQFGLSYMMMLFPKIMEINSPRKNESNDVDKSEKLNKLIQKK